MPNQHIPPPPTRPPTDNPCASSPSTRPTLHLDVEEWLPYLDDPDATYDEKIALIETLWGIVLSFVDIGWTIGTEHGRGSNLPPDTSACSIDLTRALRAAVVQLDEPEKEEV